MTCWPSSRSGSPASTPCRRRRQYHGTSYPTGIHPSSSSEFRFPSRAWHLRIHLRFRQSSENNLPLPQGTLLSILVKTFFRFHFRRCPPGPRLLLIAVSSDPNQLVTQ